VLPLPFLRYECPIFPPDEMATVHLRRAACVFTLTMGIESEVIALKASLLQSGDKDSKGVVCEGRWS